MWAIYQKKATLLVGKLISPGVRTFATVDRTGCVERINRIFVHGIFPSEDAALVARDVAKAAGDPASAKAAVKSAAGYRPLP